MSAAAILTAGTVATLGAASIPLAVAAVASPINRHRDARRQAEAEARTDRETAALVDELRHGADRAAAVDNTPGKLAAAAYVAASELRPWLAPEDLPFVARVHLSLLDLLDVDEAPDAPTATPPLTAAAALLLILNRLYVAYGEQHPHHCRVSSTMGAVADLVSALPAARAVDFNPLTEHDPVPLRRAQTAWLEIARAAGLDGWTRALPASAYAAPGIEAL